MTETNSSQTTEPELLLLSVKFEEDESLTIEWDENDPRAIELGINDWSEEDWLDCLKNMAEKVTKNYDYLECFEDA